jgi:hypothetical protein
MYYEFNLARKEIVQLKTKLLDLYNPLLQLKFNQSSHI